MRRFSVMVLVLATVAGTLVQGAGVHAGSGEDRLAVGAESWNVSGVNMPWYNWACDFGCGADGGVSSEESQRAIRPKFKELQASGLHVVRWWMFEGDGAWQIERDAHGLPSGIRESVYADLDAALALAREFGLTYDLVLFNAPGDLPAAWRDSSEGRAALARALQPLFARYKDDPRILAWEVLNEPEWQMWHGEVREDGVIATVKAIAAAVDASTSTPVTVGSANLDALGFWKGAGLDFYQAHWYDPMDRQNCALCRSADNVRKAHGLSGPIVIGEFYAGSPASTAERYEKLAANGYAGAWAWSLFADRTQDRMEVSLTGAKSWATTAPAVGPKPPAQPAPREQQAAEGLKPRVRVAF